MLYKTVPRAGRPGPGPGAGPKSSSTLCILGRLNRIRLVTNLLVTIDFDIWPFGTVGWPLGSDAGPDPCAKSLMGQSGRCLSGLLFLDLSFNDGTTCCVITRVLCPAGPNASVSHDSVVWGACFTVCGELCEFGRQAIASSGCERRRELSLPSLCRTRDTRKIPAPSRSDGLGLGMGAAFEAVDWNKSVTMVNETAATARRRPWSIVFVFMLNVQAKMCS